MSDRNGEGGEKQGQRGILMPAFLLQGKAGEGIALKFESGLLNRMFGKAIRPSSVKASNW